MDGADSTRAGRPRMREGVRALLALAAWLVAASAAAQSYAILPVERDERVDEAVRQAAGDAVASARALGPEAERLSPSELEARLPSPALPQCLDVDCAARLAEAAGLDFVVVVAVWPEDGAVPHTVSVSIVEPDGRIHEADARLGPGAYGTIDVAATAAFVEAVRRRRLGDGVVMRVASEPAGALVVMDGTDVGVTPYVGAHPPGSHSLRVRLDGYEPVEQTVELTDGAPLDIAVKLEAATAGPARHADAPGRAGPWVVAPTLLGLAGATVVGIVVGSYVADGCEVEGPAGCIVGDRVDRGAAVGYGTAGGVALAASILWFALGFAGGQVDSAAPAEAGADGRPTVRVAPEGLGLRLRF